MYKCINNDLLYILWLLSWCSYTGYTLVHLILVCEQPGLITDRCLCWSSSVRTQESVKRESYCNKWTKFLLHQSYGHLVGHSGTATGLFCLCQPPLRPAWYFVIWIGIQLRRHHTIICLHDCGEVSMIFATLQLWSEESRNSRQSNTPFQTMRCYLCYLLTYLPTYLCNLTMKPQSSDQ